MIKLLIESTSYLNKIFLFLSNESLNTNFLAFAIIEFLNGWPRDLNVWLRKYNGWLECNGGSLEYIVWSRGQNRWPR
jgi:hypothetical protein